MVPFYPPSPQQFASTLRRPAEAGRPTPPNFYTNSNRVVSNRVVNNQPTIKPRDGSTRFESPLTAAVCKRPAAGRPRQGDRPPKIFTRVEIVWFQTRCGKGMITDHKTTHWFLNLSPLTAAVCKHPPPAGRGRATDPPEFLHEFKSCGFKSCKNGNVAIAWTGARVYPR